MNQVDIDTVRKVMDALPEPAFILGPDGKLVFANHHLQELVDAPILEIPLKDWMADSEKVLQELSNSKTRTSPKVEINLDASKRKCFRISPLTLKLEDCSVAFVLTPESSDHYPDVTEPPEILGSYYIDTESKKCSLTGDLIQFTGLEADHNQVNLSEWLSLLNEDDLKNAREHLEKKPNGWEHILSIPLRMHDQQGQKYFTRHEIHVLSRSTDGRPLRFNGLVYKEKQSPIAESFQDMDAVDAVDLTVWHRDLKTNMLNMKGPIIQEVGLGHDHQDQIEIHLDEWSNYIHPDDLKKLRRDVEKHVRENGETTSTYRVRNATGDYVRVKSRSMISEQSANGEPLKISGYASVISDVDWYRDQFQKSKDDLSSALSDAGISSWLFNMQEQWIKVEGPITDTLGLKAGVQLDLKIWEKMIFPDDVAIIENAIVQLNKTGSMMMEIRLTVPSGQLVWIQMQGTILSRDADGWSQLVSCFSTDITQRRELEIALEKEKSRLNSIYARTPALMRSIRSDGHDVMVSEYWTRVTGYSDVEFHAQPIWYFAHPDDQARLKDELIGQLFKDGQITRQPVRIKTKTGDVLETRLSGFVEDSQSGEPVAHCVFEDVTDLNRARKDIEAYANELERTNRELDRFATVASHDLQEPLRKIAAFASLLKRRYEGQIDPEADQSLDYLVDAAGRMRHLIDDLLTYSRTSSRALEHQPLDLNRLLKEVVSALGVAIEEAGASIQIPSLPEILADPTLISLLFQNLISNAIKYRQADKPPQISISAEAIGRDWRFKVEDNGIGLEERFKEKIFAPFQRLHSREEYEGTGIGLAISQQAVERHGGRIWVDSEPGIGSKFYFTLPRQVENIAVA